MPLVGGLWKKPNSEKGQGPRLCLWNSKGLKMWALSSDGPGCWSQHWASSCCEVHVPWQQNWPTHTQILWGTQACVMLGTEHVAKAPRRSLLTCLSVESKLCVHSRKMSKQSRDGASPDPSVGMSQPSGVLGPTTHSGPLPFMAHFEIHFLR